ncbi:glycosyltransferase family 2 protein [Conexibacter sp. DBS9H8]|uniref:glycosyltransferase family 2 protein n=1 Tax=Conexibacter sp. DBS9H8 TaxID=2937801 RepID=UPI00200E78B6|nr:glycosyltransferase family 2 protein [Conexibacter sp. DBS9H8]
MTQISAPRPAGPLSPVEPGESAGSGEAERVGAIVARAEFALAHGERADLLAAVSDAADLTPQRRYQTAKLILEAGLRLSAVREGAALVDILVLLAEVAVLALEPEPAEPVLLNYAGVIFYELWSLEAARALFLAARRLDPELPHLDTNISGVKARLRGHGGGRARQRRPLHPALVGLGRRATALADAARPATGLRISLCMIVRDEEEMLGRCLAAVASAVDEIIVVDTGSVDGTVEIAHHYGALVLEHPWTGSFAQARNVSFAAATGDWILYLDADEVLVAGDAPALAELRRQTWREAFFLHETNFTGHDESGVAVVHSALRLFRNRPEYRFSGRLHEQIAHTLPTYLPERIRQSTVRIDHYGYLGSVRAAKEKSRRNIELLLRARADGQAPRPFDHFNLGSEYMAVENFGAAIPEFERAWEVATGTGPEAGGHYLPALAGRLVGALRQGGRPEQALVRAEEALLRFPDFTDLVYQQGLACLNLGRGDEAVAHLERCLEMGDAPSRYTAVVGCGTFLPEIVLAEEELRRGDAGAALTRLRRCAAAHRGFFGIYRPYTLALLAAGADAETAVDELETSLGDEINSMIRFMIATALLEGGATAAAQAAAAQLEAVLAARPGNPPALELLLEALLIARDFPAFAEALERFSETDLEERERRERLAQMYLRHGYLRSAAREWMTVVDSQPDAAALRGLAEVARRNGQDDTARVFAAEALKFRPPANDKSRE